MTAAAAAEGVPAPPFADPVLEAQTTFRAVLAAMAYPGRIESVGSGLVPPRPLHPSAAAVGLTLFDLDTPLWLDPACGTPEIRGFFAFHCGCPEAPGPRAARFAIVAEPGSGIDWEAFDAGTDEAPERSATVIVQVRRLRQGEGLRLTGPGIETEALLAVDGVPDAFWSWRAAQGGAFPRGVDVLFTTGRTLAALPRTTRVEG